MDADLSQMFQQLRTLHSDHFQLGELLFALDEAMDALEHQLPREQHVL